MEMGSSGRQKGYLKRWGRMQSLHHATHRMRQSKNEMTKTSSTEINAPCITGAPKGKRALILWYDMFMLKFDTQTQILMIV